MDNTYYRTDTPDIYSVVREQFKDAMQREGRKIQDYWSEKTYNCIFRRNLDTNQTNSNSTIYYQTDTGIEAGDLLSHTGRTYLTLNAEEAENGAYLKSDLIEADIMVETYSDGYELRIPCFAYDLTTANPTAGNIITLVGGNVELMTSDCEATRKLTIDSEFQAMGGRYQIQNIIYKSGICRLNSTRVANNTSSIEYTLELEALEKYAVGSVVKISATAKRTEGTVLNPTLQWSVSDSSIASVTADGMILFTGTGDLAISCLWVEHDVTETVFVEVMDATENLVCTISGRDSMPAGYTRNYTAEFYDADGVLDESVVPYWWLELPAGREEAVTIISQSGLTMSVEAASTQSGYSFVIHLEDSDGRYHTTKTVEVTGLL